MNAQCIAPTVKHSRGSVMVWGCFGCDKVGDLIQIQGTLQKEGYHHILQRHAIPSGKRLIGRGFIFQQGNDPKHASKLCKQYTINKERQRELINMKWPAQSPDLNPIELLWDELDRNVHTMRSETALELSTIMLEADFISYINKIDNTNAKNMRSSTEGKEWIL